MSDEYGHYAKAGVNVAEADKGIQRIIRAITSTWPSSGLGEVKIDIGYFANVIDFGGIGLAVTTDGVGSKTMIADMMKDYRTIGIDCVAGVVNDLICVGAKPVSMLDYLGVEFADADMLEEISVGLAEGARRAGISIVGGEVSQLPDNLAGFDLVGAGFGRVDLDKINVGEDVRQGDVIVGFRSHGIHCNGLTLARRIFNKSRVDYHEDYGLDEVLGYELLRPTAIYVQAVLDLLENIPLKAMINITGDGLLNLNRVKAEGIGFVIDDLPPEPKIFILIQKYGEIDDATMFQTFNQGIGFCVIVAPEYADDVISIVKKRFCRASVIGMVVSDKYKSVKIPQRRLIGRGKIFEHTT